VLKDLTKKEINQEEVEVFSMTCICCQNLLIETAIKLLSYFLALTTFKMHIKTTPKMHLVPKCMNISKKTYHVTFQELE